MTSSFTGPRYMTSGIAHELSVELQQLLWQLIDDKIIEEAMMDYLQVFRLNRENGLMMIVHSQEVPERRDTHLVEGTWQVQGEIFVIDDGNCVTMLFASEY